jgi:hypothetical protein
MRFDSLMPTLPGVGPKERLVPTAKTAPPETVYQLKVTLADVRPPVWRRIQVPADVTLGKLHRILQTAMGWTDSHLHRFEAGGVSYGVPDLELDFRSERSAKLRDVAPGEKAKFRYEYDFGDGWMHQLVVEKVLPAEPGRKYPACLQGKRACPPEDCGGPWGYEELLDTLKNPEHPDHEEMKDWVEDMVEGEFDPESFDQEEVNRCLSRIR